MAQRQHLIHRQHVQAERYLRRLLLGELSSSSSPSSLSAACLHTQSMADDADGAAVALGARDVRGGH